MARAPRHYDDPEQIYFITNRCINAQHFMVPTEEINAIIAEQLARSVAKYNTELFAFQFMSNHFHIIARALELNLAQFMGHFQRNLAQGLNAHYARTGSIFPRRYSAQPILDEGALWEKYAYTVLNPCRANLVSCPEQWPGVSSHHQLMTGRAWPELKEQRRRARRKRDRHRVRQPITPPNIPLTPMPGHERLSLRAQREALDAFIQTRNAAAIKEKRGAKRRTLGIVKVLRKTRMQRPKNPKRSPQPVCHVSRPALRARYLRARRRVIDAYRSASARFHSGDKGVAFPLGTFPPGATEPVRALRAAPLGSLQAQPPRGSPG